MSWPVRAKSYERLIVPLQIIHLLIEDFPTVLDSPCHLLPHCEEDAVVPARRGPHMGPPARAQWGHLIAQCPERLLKVFPMAASGAQT